MIVLSCPFDPARDVKAVEPFGFVDLKKSLSSGVVPTQIPESDESYNGIDNPSSILGKPEDVFDAMHMEKAIGDFKPKEDPK